MSNDAAIVLYAKCNELIEQRDSIEAELKKAVDRNQVDFCSRIDPLNKAIKEICNHTECTVSYSDDRYHDYHNNVERGDIWVSCNVCGHKQVSDHRSMTMHIQPWEKADE